MPAWVSCRIVSSRRGGVAARGSSVRASSRSSVDSEMQTAASPLAAIGARRSMSRVISADLVTMPSGWLKRDSTSITRRVSFSSRSIGWYGSVLVPIAITAGM
jgi:hypothetical protein